MFWKLQQAAIDMETGKKVFGINGTKLFIKQLPKEYQKIMSIYPNGKVPTKYIGFKDPRFFFDGWLTDRRNNGAKFTVNQFTKIHQYLNKIFPEWDLIVFAYGYASWDPTCQTEAEVYAFGVPRAFGALGIPFTWTSIYQNPSGTYPYEYAITIPNNIKMLLKSEYGDSIVIGFGNTFGLYHCKEGLFKDGIEKIYQYLPPEKKPTYLTAKKD